MRTATTILITCVLLMTLAAQQKPPLTAEGVPLVGEWEGTLDNGQQKMQVLLHVRRSETSMLSATADSVTEDEFGIPITTITYHEPRVRFEALDGVFEGSLNSERDEISGTWRQHGQSMAVALKRITAARAAQIVASSPAKVNVAFVISDSFNMIDFAGPWEVFSDVMTHHDGQMKMFMRAYTVAADRKPISSKGVVLVPQYTFDDAPPPDLIVIPAQSGSPMLIDWLRQQNQRHATIMSVCTGASILAESGLIDGRPATSHHDAIARFSKTYPKVHWQSSRRYVRASENIYTAAGLTSGIDLALHIVEVRFGRELAQSTANYLEYKSTGWKTSDQASSAVSAVRSAEAQDGSVASTEIRSDGATDITASTVKVRTNK
jgi:putative intracellular protease/amidase